MMLLRHFLQIEHETETVVHVSRFVRRNCADPLRQEWLVQDDNLGNVDRRFYFRRWENPSSCGFMPLNAGHLLLLFFFQFSFFLWTKLGFFLLFLFAFVSFSFITHVCFSLFESELCRTVETKPRVRSWRIADKLVWRQCQTRPSCAELHLRTLLWFCQLDSKLPIRTWFKSL